MRIAEEKSNWITPKQNSHQTIERNEQIRVRNSRLESKQCQIRSEAFNVRRRIKQWFKLPGKPEPAVPCLEVMPKAVITMAAFHAGLLSKSPDGGYDDTGFECFWAEVLNSLPELETVSTRELRAACQTWRKICPLPEEEEERGDGAHETPNAQTQ